MLIVVWFAGQTRLVVQSFNILNPIGIQYGNHRAGPAMTIPIYHMPASR